MNSVQRVPGQLTEKLFLIGFDCQVSLPQSDFVWHKQENYYVLSCNQCAVVSNLSESRQQKVFSEAGRVRNVCLAPNGRFFCFSIDDGRGSVKLIDAKSLKLLRELQHQANYNYNNPKKPGA